MNDASLPYGKKSEQEPPNPTQYNDIQGQQIFDTA